MLTFNPHVITNNLPQIGAGLATTVGAWVASTLAGAAIGFGCALAQQACGRYVRAAIRVYIELFRGTPFLVQLFLLYYGGPSFGLTFDPLTAGVVGLALYAGAYFTEAFRSGFEAVPRGHVEAAECAGFSRAQIVRRILLPEMAVLTLPASTSV